MYFTKVVLFFTVFLFSAAVQAEESSICGHSRNGDSCSGEVMTFWLGKKFLLPSISDPDPDATGCLGWPFEADPSNQLQVCHYSVPMRDGFVLNGYMFRGRGVSTERSNGYVLLGQGNAMLAEQALDELKYFVQSGLDGYVFDYRGYGRNRHGKSRVGAILEDFTDVVSHLNSRGYSHKTVYGASMGGVAALYALKKGKTIDVLVLDSVPSCIEIVLSQH